MRLIIVGLKVITFQLVDFGFARKLGSEDLRVLQGTPGKAKTSKCISKLTLLFDT